MIQAAHPLTVTRRCELLDVARSTVYYHPTGIPSEDLALMRLLDEIHLERPFYGSRRQRWTLSAGQLIDIGKWNLLRHIPVKMRGGRR